MKVKVIESKLKVKVKGGSFLFIRLKLCNFGVIYSLKTGSDIILS